MAVEVGRQDTLNQLADDSLRERVNVLLATTAALPAGVKLAAAVILSRFESLSRRLPSDVRVIVSFVTPPLVKVAVPTAISRALGLVWVSCEVRRS